MPERIDCDVCVVGAGPAGLAVAAAAATSGLSVVLVDKEATGEDRLNGGCVSSKAFLAAARRVHDVRNAGRFGVEAQGVSVDFARVREHVEGVVRHVGPFGSLERFAGLGVRIIREDARFKDRKTLLAGETELRARRFVIATGSRPAIPEIDGLGSVPFLTEETIFDFAETPRHLAVLGGGPFGIEMAQAFRRLGSEVTVLGADRALKDDDPELAAIVLRELRREGVTVREQVEVTAICQSDGGLEIALSGGEPVSCSHLLVAMGRRANIADLGLDAARISFGDDGIKVDRRLRTTNGAVYAVGSAAEGPDFPHWGAYQAEQVVRSILSRAGARVDPSLLVSSLHTDPELAWVGLGEEQARQRYGRINILRWPFAENDRAQAEGTTIGQVKVVTSTKGRILGAGIVGRGAGDLIAPWALAVTRRMSVRDMMMPVLPYPTMSEAGKRAATSFYTPRVQNPAMRVFVRLMAALG
ncbi:Pyruvate/2-oxoglutarate dehydrogenase complex, dihydrolipoamide dehydrogenase (E3) component [Faunimonas pinastri]|uniref:Pyruvate/2-oxoglutarate dehydrogenase complex, dihydrolipoamide dehydrogenase (E3) component n=1 Tax=Faunimonas pinastri TaxID=1855383 RepID=A0A1H9HD63_9HYPH|nr:NAD(P)/FAD-dependent oxidoreductase [Faunimonas pinastri]SEQ60283.1 Pyruvate/2-oxoglutarate dehydrogenase complex, dihydrolipoamide dehydrogenase (E3) component [Faunimonas pinastri]